jgi:hypothetical protein
MTKNNYYKVWVMLWHQSMGVIYYFGVMLCSVVGLFGIWGFIMMKNYVKTKNKLFTFTKSIMDQCKNNNTPEYAKI